MAEIPVWRAVPFARRRAAHLRLGRRGERLAQTLLRRLGLDVLTTNYRTAQGEVDIVARAGTMLCFVEVKTRHRRLHSRPADAVGREKQCRIIRAARRYRRDLGWPAIPHRYDIVEIVLAGRRLADVRYWPGAFTEEERPWGDTLTRFEDDDLDA
jgi:putative endonuclease